MYDHVAGKDIVFKRANGAYVLYEPIELLGTLHSIGGLCL